MVRGTTPTLTFTLPFDISTAERIAVTFSQGCAEVFTLNRDDVRLSGSTVSCDLTQQQTLLFCDKYPVMIQIRALIGGKAVASDIMTVSVGRILKDGEI